MASHDFEIVHLDTMDGFEFEAFCERMFRKLGWGSVERIGMVADGGRDIVIHQAHGSIVIECKHQPNSSIGRPVVQKLHSAVMSTGAYKGILITTGKFTREAIEHAEMISEDVEIELYDFSKLSALAHDAKIKLVNQGDESTVYCVLLPEIPEIKDKLKHHLDQFQSHPCQASDLMSVIPLRLYLKANHLVKYSIEQTFKTSVGIVHQINTQNNEGLFKTDGQLLKDDYQRFFSKALMSAYQKPTIACPIEREQFDHTSTLTDSVRNTLIDVYSTKVTYYGKNNVRYSKFCKVGPRSITFHDIKNILIPLYQVRLEYMKKSYDCQFLINQTDVKFTNKVELDLCSICKMMIKESKLLCNDCGNIAHAPIFFGSHSYTCKNCKKTICKSCTYYWRRLLFFKRILCQECADSRPNAKKRIGPRPI